MFNSLSAESTIVGPQIHVMR